MDNSELTAEKVESIFVDCLFTSEEAKDKSQCLERAVVARGIVMDAGFNPERLRAHRTEIQRLISHLPRKFSSARGHSFLELCVDQHGRQWADAHKTCQELLLLGLAIGRMKYVEPQEAWSRCRGGMPSVQVLPLPQ